MPSRAVTASNAERIGAVVVGSGEGAAGQTCPASRVDPDDPRFYDFASMVRQNELFQAMAPETLAEPAGFHGLDIDLNSCVVVGDLGALVRRLHL